MSRCRWIACVALAAMIGYVQPVHADSFSVLATTRLVSERGDFAATRTLDYTSAITTLELRPRSNSLLRSVGLDLRQFMPTARWTQGELDVSLSRPRDRWSAHVSLAPALGALVQLGTTIQSDRAIGYSGRVSVPVHSRVALSAHAEHGDRLPQTADLFYSGEGGTTRLSAVGQELGYAVRWTVLHSWELLSEYSQITFDSMPPDQAGYTLAVGGLFRRDRLALTYQNTDVRLQADYRRFRLDANLMGYQDRHQFIHFGILEAQGNVISLRGTWKQATATLFRADGHGHVAGVLQAWPFLEGLAQFIGERRHLIGSLGLRTYGASTSFSQPVSRAVTIALNTGYYRVLPSAEYRTWRPIAMGFGVDDLKQGNLDLTRADLLRLRLSSDARVGMWRVHAAAAQWIPLSIQKRASDDTSGTGSGEPSGEESDSGSHQGWRGLSLELSVGAAW